MRALIEDLFAAGCFIAAFAGLSVVLVGWGA
jgi:hypothetical protein